MTDPENWSQLEVVIGTELLASICGPWDDGLTDQRLDYLIDVVTRLRRRYDNAGVREWFTAPVSNGQRPVDVLRGAWDPNGEAEAGLRERLPAARP